MIKNGDAMAPKLVFITPEKLKASMEVKNFFM